MSNEKISRGERKRMQHFQEQEEEREIIQLSQLNNEIVPTEDFFTLELKRIKSDNKISNKEKKRLKTLAVTTEKNKKEIVSQLRKTPIVQFACERTGIGRSTYYKWRADDLIFARAADRALEAGRFFINDLAESKLIKLIQEDNVTSIIFWLKCNHPKYAAVNRIIHEYEIVTDRPSIEESNIADQEMAKIIGDRIMPTMTQEEAHIGGLRLKHEDEEAERNVKQDKRLRSFEEDDSK
jgi:hypothetical protein